MIRKAFITMAELKEKFKELIAKNNLYYDLTLIMREIEKRVRVGVFSNFDEAHHIKIEGCKILELKGKILNGIVNFNLVSFRAGPLVFKGQQVPVKLTDKKITGSSKLFWRTGTWFPEY